MTSAAGLAAGPDGCLLELDYLPCCKVVCLWCIMCFCCWGVFPVLTLYSPRSIVWGLFFSSSLSSCYAVFFFKNPCISLLIVLCMIVYVTNKPNLTLTLTLDKFDQNMDSIKSSHWIIHLTNFRHWFIQEWNLTAVCCWGMCNVRVSRAKTDSLNINIESKMCV